MVTVTEYRRDIQYFQFLGRFSGNRCEKIIFVSVDLLSAVVIFRCFSVIRFPHDTIADGYVNNVTSGRYYWENIGASWLSEGLAGSPHSLLTLIIASKTLWRLSNEYHLCVNPENENVTWNGWHTSKLRV